MKNFKRILSIVLVLAMLLLSTGCSLNFFSTDSLLKPPALTGKSGEVQEAFDKMMQGRTSFIVAHRLSTIRQSDIILVMDKGKIVEQGSHSQLIAKDGYYKKLYSSQFATVS